MKTFTHIEISQISVRFMRINTSLFPRDYGVYLSPKDLELSIKAFSHIKKELENFSQDQSSIEP